jgi:AhpD family alkylhydroperoxidase
MDSREDALPYLDKTLPEAWKAATAYGTVVSDEALRQGLVRAETELIKLRVSQLNGCLFCLDLHSRQSRHAGITQQKLDVLPAWRDASLFSDREAAVLSIAEAATQLPLNENSKAELVTARRLLGDEAFVAAEWVAATINGFNRISILSEHQIHTRDVGGKRL